MWEGIAFASNRFFFFKSTKNKNFLFFLKSKVYLFFFFLFLSFYFLFFFFLTDRHGCSDKNSLAIFLSTFRSLFFFLFFFSFFFMTLSVLPSFSLFKFFRHFYFFFFNFFIFSIFFCFCGRSFPPPSTLCTRMIRLWPVEFNPTSKSHFLSNFSGVLKYHKFFFLLVNLAAKKKIFFFLIGDLSPFQHKINYYKTSQNWLTFFLKPLVLTLKYKNYYVKLLQRRKKKAFEFYRSS